ncbi:MAG: DUF4365 domain-containing protein [Gemmataceae bacterium]|nr:DUF4365 domain-containing protein [Gemmataceae bacterium]
MATQLPGPRKQRTRQHVIADLSVHHVERFILEEGHTAQRLGSDYGYDLLMTTFDEQGYVEPGSVYFQLKAAEALDESETNYLYDLDIRDYNLWVREKMPVIFILFDASRRRAYWLTVQEYFQADVARRPKPGAKSVRIRVPKRQAVNRRAIRTIRQLKQAAIELEKEEA